MSIIGQITQSKSFYELCGMPAIYNQHLFTWSNSILFETHGIGRKIHYTHVAQRTRY